MTAVPEVRDCGPLGLSREDWNLSDGYNLPGH